MDLTGRAYYVVFYPRKAKDEVYLRALFRRLPLSIPGDLSIEERTKVTDRVMFKIKKASWVSHFANEYGVKYARPQIDDEEEVDASRPSLARPASLPVGRAAVGGEAKTNEQTGAAVLPSSNTQPPASKTRSRSSSSSDSSGSGVGQRTCEGWDSCDMPAAAGPRFCDLCNDINRSWITRDEKEGKESPATAMRHLVDLSDELVEQSPPPSPTPSRPTLARPASMPVGRAAAVGDAASSSRRSSRSSRSNSGAELRPCGYEGCTTPVYPLSHQPFCAECSDRCAVELSLSRNSTSTSMHVDLTGGDHEMDVDDAG